MSELNQEILTILQALLIYDIIKLILALFMFMISPNSLKGGEDE